VAVGALTPAYNAKAEQITLLPSPNEIADFGNVDAAMEMH
jgi:hypothetical protein